MITFYSGTPGSGKSLHMARNIMEALRAGRGVISTVAINLDVVTNKGRKKIGRFTYVDIFDLSPEYFYGYARKCHVRGKEAQTLVFLDECQLVFNTREVNQRGRMEWCKFFTHHRHFGFDFIMIAQWDRLIDKQIRCLFEHEVYHKKVNNFALFCLLPFKLFVGVTRWYGQKMREGAKWYVFRRKYARMYDSFAFWDYGVDKISDSAPALADVPAPDTWTEAGGRGSPPQAAGPGLFGRVFGRGKALSGLAAANVKE